MADNANTKLIYARAESGSRDMLEDGASLQSVTHVVYWTEIILLQP